MKIVLQRVTQASVTVDGQVIGKIGQGFLVLLGVCDTDTEAIADKMVDKLCNSPLIPSPALVLCTLVR